MVKPLLFVVQSFETFACLNGMTHHCSSFTRFALFFCLRYAIYGLDFGKEIILTRFCTLPPLCSLMFTYVIHPRNPTHSQVTPIPTPTNCHEAGSGFASPILHGTWATIVARVSVATLFGTKVKPIKRCSQPCGIYRVEYLLNLASIYSCRPRSIAPPRKILTHHVDCKLSRMGVNDKNMDQEIMPSKHVALASLNMSRSLS